MLEKPENKSSNEAVPEPTKQPNDGKKSSRWFDHSIVQAAKKEFADMKARMMVPVVTPSETMSVKLATLPASAQGFTRRYRIEKLVFPPDGSTNKEWHEIVTTRQKELDDVFRNYSGILFLEANPSRVSDYIKSVADVDFYYKNFNTLKRLARCGLGPTEVRRIPQRILDNEKMIQILEKSIEHTEHHVYNAAQKYFSNENLLGVLEKFADEFMIALENNLNPSIQVWEWINANEVWQQKLKENPLKFFRFLNEGDQVVQDFYWCIWEHYEFVEKYLLELSKEITAVKNINREKNAKWWREENDQEMPRNLEAEKISDKNANGRVIKYILSNYKIEDVAELWPDFKAFTLDDIIFIRGMDVQTMKTFRSDILYISQHYKGTAAYGFKYIFGSEALWDDPKQGVRMYRKFVSEIPEFDAVFMSIVPYLLHIGMKELEIVDMAKSAYDKSILDHVTPSGVRLDHFVDDKRDGKSLLDFDMSKLETYRKLFLTIRDNNTSTNQGAFKSPFSHSYSVNSFEAQIVEKMNLDPHFENYKGGILDMLEDISKISSVDPRLGLRVKSEYLKSLATNQRLADIVRRWKHPQTGVLEINSTNLREAALILTLISENKEINLDQLTDLVDPRIRSSGKNGNFLSMLNVDNVDISKMLNVSDVTRVLQLANTLSLLQCQQASEKLMTKWEKLDFSHLLQLIDASRGLDVNAVEILRMSLNAQSRTGGDMLIDKLGMGFLEKITVDYDSLKLLYEFAQNWGSSDRVARDVKGLYQQYGNFAFDMLADFLKQEIKNSGEDAIAEKLQSLGLNFNTLTGDLENRGFPVRREGNVGKSISRLFNGQASYVARKTFQKMEGKQSSGLDFSQAQLVRESDWDRPSTTVFAMKCRGEEFAKVIKFDPAKTGTKILLEPDGVVDMKTERGKLGSKYVFSAPLTFTTGDHKLTELAFREGQQMNWLLSAKSKDGLLVVGPNGIPKMLNKNMLKLGDFVSVSDGANSRLSNILLNWAKLTGRKSSDASTLSASDFSSLLDAPLKPAQKIADKSLFFKVLKEKKYSLLGGMLLIDEGNAQHVEDGADSRRLFVEFKDGSYGVVNSTKNMSTAEAVEIALRTEAKRAMYMDTGMYDLASYLDGRGRLHVIGHDDTADSSNRVVVYDR